MVESAIVDSQAAIFGLGEHIDETMAPKDLVREIGGAGMDGLRETSSRPVTVTTISTASPAKDEAVAPDNGLAASIGCITVNVIAKIGLRWRASCRS